MIRIPKSLPVRLILSAGMLLAAVTASAADTTPAAQLSQWSTAAGKPGDMERGKTFYNAKHGKDLSCASCHNSNPMAQGKHSSTGKAIEPLTPSANPKAFTDTAKVNKWFRRNCNDVVGRECSAQEKADFIAYVMSVKK